MKLKTWTKEQFAEKMKDALIVPADVSVARLIDDGLNILYREIKCLSMMSENGKLDPNSARDLRDHLKLLFELQAREQDSLSRLTDEELRASAKEALDSAD